MTPARRRLASVVGIALLAALALLASTQPWFSVRLAAGDGATPVPGSTAAPALAALALASLALAGALTIAGSVFRILLGALQVVLGGCVVLSAALALGDPGAAVAELVASETGIAGDSAVADALAGLSVTPWPGVTVALGILSSLAGVAVLVTARRWPGQSRRYRAVGLAPADPTTGTAPRSSVDDWDALSGGGDPTDDAR